MEAAANSGGRKKGAANSGGRKKAPGGATNRAGAPTSPAGRRREKDNRAGRGSRKRPAGSAPTNSRHQMDASLRQQLDGTDAPIERAQRMCTPRCFMDAYEPAEGESETESVAGSRRWPRVIVGQFIYTEQQPNPNGGGETKVHKKPRIYFNTGSRANRSYFKQKITDIIDGPGEADLSFHRGYEGMKQAVFHHDSIKQPQSNKVKERRMNRQQK